MTARVQHLRLFNTNQNPPSLRAQGELWVNYADLRLGFIDPSKNPQELLAVRRYVTTASYAIGDYVVNDGQLLRSDQVQAPSAFDITRWHTPWADPRSLSYYYPAQDGVTSDQTALTNAFNAAAARGTIFVAPGNINFGAFNPTSKPVLWLLSGNYTGSGTTPITVIGNGIIENVLPTWTKYFARGSTQGVTNWGPVVRVDMTVNHAGGVAGGLPAFQVNLGTTAASTPVQSPIALNGNVTLNSTANSGLPGVAVQGAAIRAFGAGNAQPFGGNLYADDQTLLPSSQGGSAVGVEFDLKANRLDDGVAADGVNVGLGPNSGARRIVMDVKYGRSSRTDNVPMDISAIINAGLITTSIDGPYCSARNGILVSGPISFAGLNFLHTAFSNNAQAIALQSGQTIGWTTAAPTSVPTVWNYLQHTTTGGARLRYVVGSTERWSVTDTGMLSVSGDVDAGGNVYWGAEGSYLNSTSTYGQVRFSSDGWRLEYVRATGMLRYVNASNNALWSLDGSGNVIQNGNLNTTGDVQTTSGFLRGAGLVVSGTANVGSLISTGVVNGNSGSITAGFSVGSLGVASTAPITGTLGVTGNITTNAQGYKPGGGVWADSSDRRIKHVVGEYTRGLDDLLKLKPVTYRFKGNDVINGSSIHHFDRKLRAGLVAQDAEEHWPELVTRAQGLIDSELVDDIRLLDPSDLTYALINALRTLNTRMNILEDQLP